MSLYKYVASERIDILIKGLIRLTPPSDFNDPFEFRPYYEDIVTDEFINEGTKKELQDTLERRIEEEHSKLPPNIRCKLNINDIKKMMFDNPAEIERLRIEALKIIMPMIKGYTPSFREKVYSGLVESIGILSLASRPDNKLMWAHYASDHKGFVLEFDENNSFFERRRSHEDEFYHLRKVRYASTRPAFKSLIELSGEDYFDIKSTEWEYEEEWRMLCPLADADEVKNTGGKTIHLFKLPAECIKGIIFGYRMLKDQRDTISKIVLGDDRYRHVILHEAVLSDVEYKITIVHKKI